MITQQYIDDHQVVERYLANQLSDEERASFEAYYLEHREVLEDLKAAAKLKGALMCLRDTGKLDELLRLPRRSHRLAAVALAASVLVVLGVTVWLAQHSSMQPTLAATAGTLPSGGRYEILSSRSDTYDVTIKLPESRKAIELRLLPDEAAEPPQYRISLAAIATDGSIAESASIGALRPGADGYVAVYLDTGHLAPGRYELRLSPDTVADDHFSSFLLEVLPPG